MKCAATLSGDELALFNEIFSAEFGLSFPENKREILESRLRPRLAALRLRSFRDYYLHLQYAMNGEGTAERAELGRALTNNETYFFREDSQFSVLFEKAAADLMVHCAQPGVIRIVSAGCSSGEEAYTLNIVARENAWRYLGWTTVIDAFDLSPARVQIARGASYGLASFRGVTPEQLQRYFVREGACHVVKPMYRVGVGFRVANLIDPAACGVAGMADVVFCRNVLIYFSESAVRRAAANFARALRTGGLLFLGHSESLIGLSTEFEPVRFGTTIAYRRVART